MKKKFSTYLVGNIFFGLSQWITVIILAKTVSISDVGFYSLALAYSGPILMLFSWGLKTIYITTENSKRETFLLNRLVMIFCFLVLIMIILLIKEFNHAEFYLILTIAFIKGIESLQEILFAFRQKKMEHQIIGRIKIFQSIGSILIVSLLFIKGFNPLYIFLLVLVFTIILALKELMSLGLIQLNLYKGIKISSILSLSLAGISLGITLAISSMNTNIPRFYLETTNGIQELGFFSSLMFFYSAGNTILFSISGFLLPIVVKNMKNIKYIKKIYLKISVVFWITAIFGWIFLFFFGDVILSMVYTSEFAYYHSEFLIIMIGAILTYYVILIDVIFNAWKKFNNLLYIQIGTIIIISVASYVLIPDFSTLGAAISFLIGIVFQFVIKCAGVIKLMNYIEFNNIKNSGEENV